MPKIKGPISEEKAKEVIMLLVRHVGKLRGLCYSLKSEFMWGAPHNVYQSDLVDETNEILRETAFNLDELVDTEIDWEDMNGESPSGQVPVSEAGNEGSNPSSPAKR